MCSSKNRRYQKLCLQNLIDLVEFSLCRKLVLQFIEYLSFRRDLFEEVRLARTAIVWKNRTS